MRSSTSEWMTVNDICHGLLIDISVNLYLYANGSNYGDNVDQS